MRKRVDGSFPHQPARLPTVRSFPWRSCTKQPATAPGPALRYLYEHHTREIDVPLVEAERHVSRRVSEVEPHDAPHAVRRRCDRLHVEELAREVLHYLCQRPALAGPASRSEQFRAARDGSSVAFGGYSLEDHWNRGDALAAIRQGGWDLVVMQQGPSALPESRTHLIEWTARFAAEIRKVGARPALYMVWPPLDRESEWDAVTASYAAAAAAAARRALSRRRGTALGLPRAIPECHCSTPTAFIRRHWARRGSPW